jgi:hypothetical protein
LTGGNKSILFHIKIMERKRTERIYGGKKEWNITENRFPVSLLSLYKKRERESMRV